jgi:hypothetical protein
LPIILLWKKKNFLNTSGPEETSWLHQISCQEAASGIRRQTAQGDVYLGSVSSVGNFKFIKAIPRILDGESTASIGANVHEFREFLCVEI